MDASRTFVFSAVLCLAACDAQPANEAAGTPPTASETAAEPRPMAAASAAAPIDLGAVTEKDFAAVELSGELGCSFMPALGGEALWIGRGDVLPAAGTEGLVVIDAKPVKLAMDGTGGFAAMERGARFSAGDLQVAFARTADEPIAEDPQIAMESPAYPATMTVTRAAQELVIQGVLECGP